MERVPVLIVGGGGAGLTASMLLAGLDVEHLLISSRPGTSDLPKAHVLNQRAMEILDDAGVADLIEERGTPAEAMVATAFYAGFGGSDPDAGRRIAKLESWGAGGADEHWRAASPRRQCNLPQIRLEPLLRARAEELSPMRIRFNHELIELSHDEEGVTAIVRDNNEDGQEYEIRADYLIGADGGRTIPAQIGVEYEGLGVVSEAVSFHVSADFSGLTPDPDVLIRWIISPERGAGVVMVPMGPERWGPDSEEWVIHLQYLVADPRAASDEAVLADLRAGLGIPDLPVQIHKISRWTVDAVLASSFREGRVFLVGDAAHRHPPTGGLGLTSAMHDVHNLCWKLAAVLAGQAGVPLLDTYEAERRPADARNAQRSLENAINHLAIIATAGSARRRAPRRTGKLCDGCGARSREMPITGPPSCAEFASSRWSSTSTTSSTDSLMSPPRSSPTGHRSPRTPTTSASTCPRPDPARRCPMPGSRTSTASAVRSRISCVRVPSWSSPVRRGRPGARRQSRFRGSLICLWMR